MQNTTNPEKNSTRAATGAGIVFFAQIAGYGLYFLAQRLIISNLSKDAYGALSYIQLMSSLILVIVVDAGMNNVALREMIKRPEKRNEIIATVFWFRFMSTVLIGFVIAVACYLSGIESWTTASLAVAMISLSSRSSMIRSSLELPFRERMSFVEVSLCFIADWLLYLVLLFIGRTHLSAQNIFALQILASIPATLYLAWRIGLLRILFPLPAWSLVRELLRDTAPQTSQLVLQNVHSGVDLGVLKAYAPQMHIGIVNAVANMGQIILTAFVALSSTLYPMIADAIQLAKDNAAYRIERSLSVVTFVAILLATVLSTLSPLVAFLFTKNVYADNILQFQLQFWLSVIACIAQMSLLVNSAQNEHRAVFFSGLFLAVGSLTADFFLIPWFYSSGYILAKCWSNSLSAAISLWFVGRYTGFALVRRFVLRTLGVAALCLPYSVYILNYWPQLPASVVGLLLCCAVSWMVGLVSTDELRLAQRLIDKIFSSRRSQNNAQV